MGANKEKILLLLLGGLALGLTRSPKGYFKLIKSIHEEFKAIDQRSLKYAIDSLYKSKLIEQRNNNDGTTTFILTSNGKKIALKYNLDKMEIAKNRWDRKWRIVIFDIPERLKKVRDALRFQLKKLGFLELQHSVWILPYECQNEIEYIIEFYNARRFVRFIEASSIDNELHLKHKFKLI